jgi:2-polyprenyl-6-methoxyphenol hydroxylase-like FAD-dependent oxidoreductase
MKLSNYPVLISGGGIAGLTLANCLKSAKIPFLVLEKSPQIVDVGGGIGLWGPALKALNSLNLEDSLKENGKLIKSAGFRNFDQIDKGEWLVQPSNKIVRHTSCLTLRKSHLLKTLLKNLEPHEIKLNANVVDYLEKENGIQAILENGEIILGSILIGADGINSNIRKKLFPCVKKKPCNYKYWQGIAKIENLGEVELGYNKYTDDFPSYEAWHPKIRFCVVPLKSPEVFWFVAYDNDLHYDIDYNDNDECKNFLVKLCEPFGNNVKKILDLTESSSIKNYDLAEINIMKKWAEGRVCLLGDAAHVMAPNLAQGALLSIEDALELAHQLYIIYDHNGEFPDSKIIEQSFREYERKRIKRYGVVQTLIPLIHSVGTAKNNLYKLRNFIFLLSPNFLKTIILDLAHRFALGWNYTAPNLGTGLYKRLLGAKFLRKCKVLDEFHSGDVNRFARGKIKVIRNGLINNIIANLSKLPQSTENGTVELFVTTDKSGIEKWNRKIYDSKGNLISEFNTIQSLFNEQLLEEYKIFYFIYDSIIIEESHQFDLILNEFGIKLFGFRFKVPKFLRPSVSAYTKETDTGWNFGVQISHPKLIYEFLGDILKYEGTIDKIRH